MSKATRMLVYARDLSATQDKFAGLAALIDKARRENMFAVMVESPQVLGDTYDELVTNLDALAAADLSIMIVPPAHRPKR
jgi:hypothetical protein